MGAFFVYLIKSGFALAVFYIFYHLLVSKHTFHRINRVVLLGMIVLAALLPLGLFSYSVTGTGVILEKESGEFLFWTKETFVIPVQVENTGTTSVKGTYSLFWRGIFILYLAGMISILL